MISLNYTYYKINNDIILRWYLILFGILFKEIENNDNLDDKSSQIIIEKIKKISSQKAKKMIKYSDDKLFASPMIKNLMLLSYDYEINGKLLWKKTSVNIWRTNRIMNIFNQIWWINYKKEIKGLNLWKYNLEKFYLYTQDTYEDIDKEITLFLNTIWNILNKAWYINERKILQKSIQHYKINTIYSEDVWSHVKDKENEKDITIYLNSRKKTTLYHEYTHILQRIIRKEFNINMKWFELISQNEWVSNFIAYNLFDNIWSENLDHINLEHIFFPKYNYIYNKLYNNWSKSTQKNYKLISKELKKIWYKNEEEIRGFYFRFFKFLPLNQNKHLYPKELLYKIWYEKTLESFIGKNKIKNIADLLLYKTKI